MKSSFWSSVCLGISKPNAWKARDENYGRLNPVFFGQKPGPKWARCGKYVKL